MHCRYATYSYNIIYGYAPYNSVMAITSAKVSRGPHCLRPQANRLGQAPLIPRTRTHGGTYAPYSAESAAYAA